MKEKIWAILKPFFSNNEDGMKTVPLETFWALVAILTGVAMWEIYYASMVVDGWTSDLTGPWLGLATFSLLMGIFVYSSLKEIPSDPPQKAMPMVFGRLVNRLIGPGWIFIPFSGFILGYKPIGNEIFGIDFTVEEKILGGVPPVKIRNSNDRTKQLGDRTGVVFPIRVFFSIDPKNPAQTVAVGGIEQVKDRLKIQLDKCLRRWIVSKERGPRTLDDARQMSDEAVNELVDELIEDDIARIPDSIPWQAILIAEMNHRPLSPKEIELLGSFRAMSPEDQAKIQQATQERVALVKSISRGTRALAVHGLGIVVKQIVVGNIEPDEKTKKAMEQVVDAEYNAEAQRPAMKSLDEEADLLQSEDPKISRETALRLALIRRGTVKEAITRVEIPDETSAAAGNIIGKAILALFGGRKD